MKRNEIRAALILRGITISDVARQLNCSVAAVSMVISGTSKSQRIMEAVAAAIGKKVREIWPEVAA